MSLTTSELQSHSLPYISPISSVLFFSSFSFFTKSHTKSVIYTQIKESYSTPYPSAHIFTTLELHSHSLPYLMIRHRCVYTPQGPRNMHAKFQVFIGFMVLKVFFTKTRLHFLHHPLHILTLSLYFFVPVGTSTPGGSYFTYTAFSLALQPAPHHQVGTLSDGSSAVALSQ